jgi:hypothetical protein
MTTETSQDEIIMTIFCSQGRNNYPITIKKGLLWEDAKKIVKSHGYNVDTMKAIESTRKGVLEHPKAVLPTENFRLHLYPFKSKGGVKAKKSEYSRAEINAQIKGYLSTGGAKADAHFNSDVNYTRKKSEELIPLIEKWAKKHGPAPEITDAPKKRTVKAKVKEEVSEEKAEAIGGVVGSLAQQAKEYVADTPAMAIKTSIHLLRGISGHENQVDIEQAITLLGKALILKPTPSEQELIDKEHKELASGLQGINY